MTAMLKNHWKTLGFSLAAVITTLVLVFAATASKAPATITSPIHTHAQATSPNLMAQAFSKDDVDAIARSTTVVIADGLAPEDVNNSENRLNLSLPGSGVIVDKRGSTYYVLTNTHVVDATGADYGIRTSDNQVHKVLYESEADGRIHRFFINGENEKSGFDLALIKFEDSQHKYHVATIGDQKSTTQGDTLYVSGWPDTKRKDRKREFKEVKVQKIIENVGTPPLQSPTNPPQYPDAGYGIQYEDKTAGGMSGGPVFNARGEVVAIHGREGAWGIQINHFIEAEKKLDKDMYNLSFTPSPMSEVIAAGKRDIEIADNIGDFYDIFQLESAKSIEERYGCPFKDPDGAYRLGKESTRGEFAVILDCSLNGVETLNILKGAATQEDITSLQQSLESLSQQIQSLKESRGMSFTPQATSRKS